MSKVVVVVQARLGSERLPNKVLSRLGGSTMLAQIVRRCRASRVVDEVVVASPVGDDQKIFEATGIMPIPGPEKDLLTRLLNAARKTDADVMIRVTADCPFVCPRMIESMVSHHSFMKKPMTVNWIGRTFPDGLDLEVYDVEWLEQLGKVMTDEDEREYFAQWIVENADADTVEKIANPEVLGHKYRFTVDYPEDLEFVKRIYAAMKDQIWDSRQIIDYLQRNKHLLKINAHRIDGKFGARVWRKKP
jgi:spore coat polysaccharide biosynthesis protein SpsF (cytidylyltransferase family)